MTDTLRPAAGRSGSGERDRRSAVPSLERDSPDCLADIRERLAEVLPPVRRQKDERMLGKPPELRRWAGEAARLHSGSYQMQGVDAGISSDEDPSGRNVFPHKIPLRERRGRKMKRRDCVGGPAIELLGEGVHQVVRPKPRLHVADRDLLIEGGHGGRQRGRGVAVHENQIRRFALQDRFQTLQRPRVYVGQRLPVRHDIEVVLAGHAEQPEHLVEHVAVLGRHDDLAVELPRTLLEGKDDGRHLHRLRPRPEYRQYSLHGPLRHAANPRVPSRIPS